jgi:uncharacterized membrane protein YGL010W
MNLGELIRHPAVVTGLLRALLAVAVSFGLQVTQEQSEALMNLQTAIFVVLSLVLTAGTVATTQRKPAPADEVVIGPPEGND